MTSAMRSGGVPGGGWPADDAGGQRAGPGPRVGRKPAASLASINDFRYYGAVIRSFRCKETERLFQRQSVRRFKAIESVARRKLEMLEAAQRLDDLRVPPGNRLEALTGDRKGQHSIRVNDQFRICFTWREGGPEMVEIVDYH